MKNQIYFFILMLFIPILVKAQKSRDVLILKNGSNIYGQLIEIDSGKYKIRTADGSMLVFRADEVQKFSESVKEAGYYEGRKDKGFSLSLESGFLVGSQKSSYIAPFSFNMLGGFIHNTKTIVSAGSGIEFIGRPFTPIFLEFKYIFNNKKTSPFFFARGGVLTALGGEEDNDNTGYNYYIKDYSGGLSYCVGSGISWAKQDYETYLSFAFRHASTSFVQYEHYNGDVEYENNMNRLEIKFGFKF